MKLTQAEAQEFDLSNKRVKEERARLIEKYCAHDTIYDLGYIMKKLRAREIDNDEKARSLIEIAVDFIIRNRPLKWADLSTGLSTDSTGGAYGDPLCNGHKPQP